MVREEQCASHVIMVEPRGFCSNPQTSGSNFHQAENPHITQPLQDKALQEHQQFQALLKDYGIEVSVFEGHPEAPDDLFCNNWILTRSSGYSLFPMMAPNRRIERRQDIIDILPYPLLQDYTCFEAEGKFLESTGSLVLDRPHRIAYAALSPRTDRQLVENWCGDNHYTPVIFESYDKQGRLEYHTNVMMFVGSRIAGVCMENIQPELRDSLKKTLAKHHVLLELTAHQVEHFAGNAIELKSLHGKHFLVMSQTGFNSLSKKQKEIISSHMDGVITPELTTIETYGGGSARCLLLEVF